MPATLIVALKPDQEGGRRVLLEPLGTEQFLSDRGAVIPRRRPRCAPAQRAANKTDQSAALAPIRKLAWSDDIGVAPPLGSVERRGFNCVLFASE